MKWIARVIARLRVPISIKDSTLFMAFAGKGHRKI